MKIPIQTIESAGLSFWWIIWQYLVGYKGNVWYLLLVLFSVRSNHHSTPALFLILYYLWKSKCLLPLSPKNWSTKQDKDLKDKDLYLEDLLGREFSRQLAMQHSFFQHKCLDIWFMVVDCLPNPSETSLQ